MYSEGILHKSDHGIVNCKEINRGTEDVLIFEIPLLLDIYWDLERCCLFKYLL